MEIEFLRVPTILCDLQKLENKESAISSLVTLNEVISSSQEEMEFLYRSNGIAVIMSFFGSDSKFEKICLKILTNSSRRHEKIRKRLLENNILGILAVKLKEETDFSKTILILYCALIVVLVRYDNNAQNQMRTSECLSSLVYILTHILYDVDQKPLPSKNTELIIYAIIASFKVPRHTRNQTEVGRITPKILEYLEKQTVYSDNDQLKLTGYFWFLLTAVLDKNEENQQIFFESFGLSVLFRSLQEAAGVERREETEDLLVKITGVLVRLKSHKEFLSEAANYCPIAILSSLLQTCNCLIMQHSIIFLDSLTREIPLSLQFLRGTEILKQLKQAEIILMNNKTRKLCQDLWNRITNYTARHMTEENSLSFNEYSNFLTFTEENLQELTGFSILQNHFCVVHGSTEDDSSLIFNLSKNVEAVKSGGKDDSPMKIRPFGTNLNFRRNSRERQQKLKRIMTQSFWQNEGVNRFNVFGIARRKIIQVLNAFLSFFHTSSNS